MASASSTLAAAIAAGKQPTNKTRLSCLDDKVTVAVGTFASTEYARFGVIPAGAVIVPHLSRLTTNHTAAVPGKLTLVPIDGSASTDIASVTAHIETVAVSGNAEAVEYGSILDNIDGPATTVPCYVQFTPTSDTTIASTAKNFWLRLGYRTLA